MCKAKDLISYKIIIHCGDCVLNKTTMFSRFNRAIETEVSTTSYDVVMSIVCGVIEKVLEVFSEALSTYKKHEFS
jgi:predicted sugar kinase